MKVGDRVALTVDDKYFGHEVGDEGTIVSQWWSEGDETMFGVDVEYRCSPGDEFGWSYTNKELEVI